MCIRCGKILRNTIRVNSSYFHYSQNLKLDLSTLEKRMMRFSFYIIILPY